jgi:hypothetical protein
VLIGAASTAQAGVNVWTSHGPFTVQVYALAIDPTTPSTLYVSMYDVGVFKSIDAGRTWDTTGPLLVGDAWALAIDPITPSTLYAATTYVVSRSSDSGASWQGQNSGLNTCSLSALAINPLTPSILYVAALYHDDSGCGGLFKSVDGGLTWTAADAGLPPAGLHPSGGPASVAALAIDPVTPTTLYAGIGGGFPAVEGQGVFKSIDAGVTWFAANAGFPPSTCVSAVAVDPLVPSTLYAASGGIFCGAGRGVFKSTDAGATWNATGLTNASVSALAIDPTVPSTLYAGAYDDGVFKSTDAGATWDALNAGLTNTLVAALAIDPLTPSRLYAGSSGVFALQQVACVGDCNLDGLVTIDEIITGINIALDTQPLEACAVFDAGDGRVTVDTIVVGVNNALDGCPQDHRGGPE